MGNHMRRASAGDPLSISASAWNRVLDAAQYVERLQRSGGLSFGSRHDALVAPVRNESGADVPQWGVLGIKGVISTPGEDGNLTAFRDRIAFRGRSPGDAGGTGASAAARGICIALEPIPKATDDGQYSFGLCLFSGLTQVRLIGDEKIRAAGASNNSVRVMKTHSEGAASVVWDEGDKGDPRTERWAIVCLGGTGSECPGQNCIQSITMYGQPDGGDVQLRICDQWITVPVDAAANDIENAMNAFAADLGDDPIAVEGGPFPNATMSIEFIHDQARTPQSPILADWSGVTGGTGVGVLVLMVREGRND